VNTIKSAAPEQDIACRASLDLESVALCEQSRKTLRAIDHASFVSPGAHGFVIHLIKLKMSSAGFGCKSRRFSSWRILLVSKESFFGVRRISRPSAPKILSDRGGESVSQHWRAEFAGTASELGITGRLWFVSIGYMPDTIAPGRRRNIWATSHVTCCWY
jgi:hypothetical protein